VVVFTGWATTRDWSRLQGRVPAAVLVWDYEFWVEGDSDMRARMRAAFAQSGLTLVAGSTAVASMLDAMGLAAAVIIPPGIDHSVFAGGPDVRARTAVGLLDRSGPRRGIDDAVAALERVRERDHDVRCLVAGRGAHEVPNWLERRATASDAQLAVFYQELAVFVLPSRVEGLGLPPLEAMACGAAVVVTDNGGSRQYARDGENCLVVPVGDVEAMSDAVLRLLRDDELRARVAAEGNTTALTFTWERAVGALEHLLAELASGSSELSASTGSQ
jgi:glycosyltransferase involved in cell wall biosynthesis